MDFKDIKEKEMKNEHSSQHPIAVNDINTTINNNINDKMDIDHENIQLPELHSVDDLKKVIYKTYGRSIDKSKENKKKERKKLKNIMNLLIYLQMKKVELKLNYFNEFEKMIQYEKQQIKTLQSQLIGDKIHLAMKKYELTNLSNKLKDSIKTNSEYFETHDVGLNSNGCNGVIEKADRFNVELDNRIMDLN